jgi:hypothetical protein
MVSERKYEKSTRNKSEQFTKIRVGSEKLTNFEGKNLYPDSSESYGGIFGIR